MAPVAGDSESVHIHVIESLLYGTTMNRLIRLALLALTGISVATAPAGAEPLRLAYSTWAAWGPFFIAHEKGWFEEEGVEVEFVRIEDASARATALAAGVVDATSLTLDAVPLFLRPEAPLRFAFALASSRGGDAMLTSPDIETIADLKGRRIAVKQGGPMHFFIGVLLQSAGLSEHDVTLVDLEPGIAGSAFLAGKVDAAVTWEPWVSRGVKARKGHLLTDTADHPGLITDMLVVRGDRLDARADEFRALYRAWNRAVAFTEADRDEATAMMARGVGGWLGHADVYDGIQSGLAYFDAASNEMFFGVSDEPGLLSETVGRALEIWAGYGKLRTRTTPAELVSRVVVGDRD